MKIHYMRPDNNWAFIDVHQGTPDGTRGNGDMLRAEFDPAPMHNLRTATGRRRLRRFIDKLEVVYSIYERRYG